MSGYLGSVIAVSAVVAFCGIIMKEGGNDGISRAAMGIILLSAVITPAISLACEIADFDIDAILDSSETEGGENVYEQTAEDAFCRGVEKLICDEYSLSADNVEVRVFGFDITRMCAAKIKIILSGSASLADSRAICAYVRECGLGDCEAELEIT